MPIFSTIFPQKRTATDPTLRTVEKEFHELDYIEWLKTFDQFHEINRYCKYRLLMHPVFFLGTRYQYTGYPKKDRRCENPTPQHSDHLPVVPHKAVAEVSKIGNL